MSRMPCGTATMLPMAGEWRQQNRAPSLPIVHACLQIGEEVQAWLGVTRQEVWATDFVAEVEPILSPVVERMQEQLWAISEGECLLKH